MKSLSHITIITDINNQSPIIHCSSRICTYQFSGRNLSVIAVDAIAISVHQADSIDFHTQLAGPAIPRPYPIGL